MSRAETATANDHAVGHLLEQYKEYLRISQKIDQLKTEQMQTAMTLAAASGKSFAAVLAQPPSEIQAIFERLDNTRQEQQRVSDEMKFANPAIWMMYKYKAYLGTSQAVIDMQDFRKHCSKPGYICTKRYTFLCNYLKQRDVDLTSIILYPNEMPLPDVYGRDAIVGLSEDNAFMNEWNMYEYHTDKNSVAKWENYVRSPASGFALDR